MIGTILGNRYEILSEVGTGGMARVYKAKDRYLQRIVAIKVLKDEFREDTEFLKRFDTEAQAAASLTHPNIVQIYDVGRDNNQYYIVMEYVDGITLKEYIQKKGHLEWREAVNLSIQVCSALSKAHSRNIVHRDIKPTNIIMTSEGVPKVADFGIARSVSSDTKTMKVDTVGSVHYSSPEQVRGGFIDKQSDIYSIGVTMFEMVTGKLPFDGETPVAVALKHIQEEPPVPSSVRPGIPPTLDKIILKAMAKSRQERYSSVTELIGDLERLRGGQGASSEIVLPIVKRDEDRYSTKKFAPLGDEELKRKNGQKVFGDEDEDEDEEKSGGRNRKYVMPILYIVLIVAILGGIGYFVSAILGDLLPGPEESPQEVTLSTYVGRDLEEVKQELAQQGITPVIHEEYYDDADEGVIYKQEPLPDTEFKAGGLTQLELWVSKGKKMVTIPDLTGEDHNTARLKLRDDYGLVVDEKPEYNEQVPINQVIKTVPGPEAEVEPGSKVTVYYSLGPEKKPVVVPNVIGKTYDQAVKILQDKSLKVGTTYPEDRQGYQGKIIDQAPKGGETVDEDTAVNLYFEESPPEPGETGTPGGDLNKTITVDLPEGYNFGDTVRVRVYAKDIATGEQYEIKDEKNVSTKDFPYSFTVPVPVGGVEIKVYVNDILVKEQTY